MHLDKSNSPRPHWHPARQPTDTYEPATESRLIGTNPPSTSVAARHNSQTHAKPNPRDDVAMLHRQDQHQPRSSLGKVGKKEPAKEKS
ncbi:hypothetical protein Nepgr_033610 [Nepenthes gracilis]|uniref:Uncharacterized protein n=1 Tax=Nepenthes gracilis TaxID=150966 RepID=A0AAD3TM82_NEPGR|nr:hypothetical protein Nepgr_033610 [Nepenthes gracilis]